MSGDAPRPDGPLRAVGRLLFVAGGVAAGVVAAAAAERVLVRRARRVPDIAPDELLEERPGSEGVVTSFDGTELAVHSAGPENGPTLVFLHGFTQDMTAWHFQWKRFAETYRCLLYDQRGHGRSRRSAGGGYSLEALARDLEAVLDAECADTPVVLVGHSMGGMAILSFASHFPAEFGERVRGVVLASTAASELVKEVVGGLAAKVGGLYVPAPRLLNRNLRVVGAVRARAFAGSADLAWLMARYSNFGPGAPPSLVDHVVGVARETPVEVWADLVRSMLDMDFVDALAAVTCPALVIVGDADRLTPPASARLIAAGLPDARLVVLEGAGHLAMMEHPDAWNEAVDRFVSEVMPLAASPAGRRRGGSRRASHPRRSPA